ncbi:GNAT family N-acetyltransferase [Paenibacillus pinistramenti]|uniref:GNAT family N-acetyltransferase n=1 Tax=Paenibacillus pinistramenti TaxID=1768003 RepID=UPI001107FCAE|nr:GNAT family N-acetyltransferase [Paenibacillus pinistramenti]
MSAIEHVELTTASGQSFQLAEAVPAEAEVVRQLLVEAAEWMQRSGIDQWKPEFFSLQAVQAYFNHRRIFVAYDRGTPAGMFTLQNSDPGYWKENDDPDYYYLHRLTVSVPYRSCGLGKAMLEWAVEKAGRDRKKGLRLDCRRISGKLNSFYQNQGFRFKGISEQADHLANLYER